MFRNVHLTPFLLSVKEDCAVAESGNNAVEDMYSSQTTEYGSRTHGLAIACFAVETEQGETVKDGGEREDDTDHSS